MLSKKQKPAKQYPSDRHVPKILLTVEEASWSIGLAPATIYELVSEKRIPYVKLGKRTMFRPKELEDWAEKHAVAVPDED